MGFNQGAVMVNIPQTLNEQAVQIAYMLDQVRGAGHFEVSERRAVRLMTAVAAKLPGYLVPKLVREEPGASFKIPVPGIGIDKDL